jgi:hypothetical protein
MTQVIYRSNALVTAELGKVCLIYWRRQPNAATFSIQKQSLDSVVRKHGSGVGVICVVEEQCDPPEEEIRKASSRMIIDHGERIVCVGCVIEGSGFRAAITRAALSGITFMIRTPAPIKFFITPHLAAKWVASQMPVGQPEEFVQNVERLRDQFVSGD